jgi:hypothetical protein
MWGPLCTRIAFCGTVRDWLLREFDACKAVGFSDDPHDRFEQMDWLVTFLRADMIPSSRALALARLSRLRRMPPGQYFYIDRDVLPRFTLDPSLLYNASWLDKLIRDL